jgi:hypothetical protein
MNPRLWKLTFHEDPVPRIYNNSERGKQLYKEELIDAGRLEFPKRSKRPSKKEQEWKRLLLWHQFDKLFPIGDLDIEITSTVRSRWLQKKNWWEEAPCNVSFSPDLGYGLYYKLLPKGIHSLFPETRLWVIHCLQKGLNPENVAIPPWAKLEPPPLVPILGYTYFTLGVRKEEAIELSDTEIITDPSAPKVHLKAKTKTKPKRRSKPY